jgi:hypothetical protein
VGFAHAVSIHEGSCFREKEMNARQHFLLRTRRKQRRYSEEVVRSPRWLVVYAVTSFFVATVVGMSIVPSEPVPWSHEEVVIDGRRLVLHASDIVCDEPMGLDAVVRETPATVTVTVRQSAGFRPLHLISACPQPGHTASVEVLLDAPLGTRRLIDGTGGDQQF